MKTHIAKAYKLYRFLGGSIASISSNKTVNLCLEPLNRTCYKMEIDDEIFYFVVKFKNWSSRFKWLPYIELWHANDIVKSMGLVYSIENLISCVKKSFKNRFFGYKECNLFQVATYNRITTRNIFEENATIYIDRHNRLTWFMVIGNNIAFLKLKFIRYFPTIELLLHK